ncbi:MAG: hypothetical protein ACR2IV_22990 [Bryobacteraceae bacterium]
MKRTTTPHRKVQTGFFERSPARRDLGLVGSIAAQLSSEAATGIGLYGAAWSVFNHVVARGHNILLAQDTPVQIRFGAARE